VFLQRKYSLFVKMTKNTFYIYKERFNNKLFYYQNLQRLFTLQNIEKKKQISIRNKLNRRHTDEQGNKFFIGDYSDDVLTIYRKHFD